MRLATILVYVPNLSTCNRIDDLGFAVEDWLAKKRQYEEFSTRDGTPCRILGDCVVPAMYKIVPKSIEETVMFKGYEDTFESLFDKLVSFASVKHSLRMDDKPARAGTK